MPSLILRDISVREANVVQTSFSALDLEYWGIDFTRAGNLRFSCRPAAFYMVGRLRDVAYRTDHSANARGADRLAARIELLLLDRIAASLTDLLAK